MYIEYSDPRLVSIYDWVNLLGEEKQFYLGLARDPSVATVIDIGCGTGLLTYELARLGRNVVGVEPSRLMLEAAQQRLAGLNAEWIEGSAAQIGGHKADLAIMTGHVAQFFLDEEAWDIALHSIQRALNPGGCLAFETRNPKVAPFVGWPTMSNHRVIKDTVAGEIEWWGDRLKWDGNHVHYEIHYMFMDNGHEEVVSYNELVFRTEAEIAQSLEAADFSVQNVYGNWDRAPVDDSSRELIFVARKK